MPSHPQPEREIGDPVAFALEQLGDRAEAAVAAGGAIEPTGLVVTAAGAARLLRGKTDEQVEEALRYLAGRERLLVAALLRSGTGAVIVHAEAPDTEPLEVRWPVLDGSLGPPRAQRVAPRLLS